MDYNQVFYQIYPLGFCDAPRQNDGILVPRIRKVLDWIPHLQKLGITAVYFGPVFDSDAHGYDTRDYAAIDCRLGSNQDFADVADALHDAGIKVVLDGVFNHVGRGFFAFRDVQEKKWDSVYSDWFCIDYGNTNTRDGFGYEDWEGHPELVKLNLDNEAVCRYLLERIDTWIAEFGIDGLRLDVAYCLNRNFMRMLRSHVKAIDPDFFLLGEMVGGNYRDLCNDEMLDSVTNYECRKGLYSSMNTSNLFEIGYSLNRQFGPDPWDVYTGLHLLSFADNHDVDRLASVLNDPRDLPLVYALMFAMPGIPCIYYGSEWGAKGARTKFSDHALRPSFDAPQWNELTDEIAALARARREYPVLSDGDYQQVLLQNKQMIFRRRNEKGQLLFALNIDDSSYHADFDAQAGRGLDLVTRRFHDYGGGSDLPAKSASLWYTPNDNS